MRFIKIEIYKMFELFHRNARRQSTATDSNVGGFVLPGKPQQTQRCYHIIYLLLDVNEHNLRFQLPFATLKTQQRTN